MGKFHRYKTKRNASFRDLQAAERRKERQDFRQSLLMAIRLGLVRGRARGEHLCFRGRDGLTQWTTRYYMHKRDVTSEIMLLRTQGKLTAEDERMLVRNDGEVQEPVDRAVSTALAGSPGL